MDNRIFTLQQAVSAFPGISVITAFEKREETLYARITMTERGATLPFDVVVYPQYPYQFHESETIHFINKDLLAYDHVNADGSVCIHTLHHPELSAKVALDLNGLKHWIARYYINHEKDKHYEHIIVEHTKVNEVHSVFLFTDVDYTFKKNMYGRFTYSMLNTGAWRETGYTTYLVQHFKSVHQPDLPCKWSSVYCSDNRVNEGLFYFNDHPPVENRRFAVRSFHQLESYFTQDFLHFLNTYSKKPRLQQFHPGYIPVMIGYTVNGTEIHWQVILISINEMPGYGQKVTGIAGTWITKLKEQPIFWAQTRNCSYSCFFGRGSFHAKLTSAKILIIGVGAIGSMVATTLTRGGATDIMLVDHDLKEPENVCRSEFFFLNGLTAKVNELMNRLVAISPFIEVKSNEALTDYYKMVIKGENTEWITKYKNYLDEFDIIIDCSTDNDMAFLLGDIDFKGDIFCLSITNHARELVCGTKHDLYPWLQHIFQLLSEGIQEDPYVPTGCWSPTFKASYNDIAVLVQYALRHINNCYTNAVPFRHFYLSCNDDNGFNIKLHQF